jgi:hypothetical protein
VASLLVTRRVAFLPTPLFQAAPPPRCPPPAGRITGDRRR